MTTTTKASGGGAGVATRSTVNMVNTADTATTTSSGQSRTLTAPYCFRSSEEMMTAAERVKHILTKFDSLASQAGNIETKLLIEALKLHSELVNLRLAEIEQQLPEANRAQGE
ncbi:hypothetical protein [Cupriavidus sp. D39]|uniref:hypothetical protein n=1 Tax=Cupriavidus sp. D39 TaxID=2997877 RepID=UPI00226EBF5B|nr:hypothetical protein [Cupriavidus sp. D39]MCY0855128.1 hypothetical protein [Cupriavidus sp. D39]